MNIFRKIIRTIKSFFQKRFRGYTDEDLWDLSVPIAKFISPRLKAFKKNLGGYPVNLASAKEWEETIDKMLYAFELIIDDNLTIANCEKYEEGMKLFAEYLCNLWD